MAGLGQIGGHAGAHVPRPMKAIVVMCQRLRLFVKGVGRLEADGCLLHGRARS